MGVGGANITVLEQTLNASYQEGLGATRYKCSMPDNQPLESMLINRGNDTLVVSFHGALDRDKFTIPRFERVSTLLERPFNILAFADPGLHYHSRIQLTWFTGPPSVDYFTIIAERIKAAAKATGSTKVILSGSSGGGFAALQIAPLLEGSVALVFNPQTQIHKYILPNGSVWAQRNYLNEIAPSLWPSTPEDLGKVNWTTPLKDRLSAVERYQSSPDTHVVYATNFHDWHHKQHFIPFRDSLKKTAH